MIYEISLEDAEKILNNASENNFVVNDNIRKLFLNYNFHKFTDEQLITSVLSSLKVFAVQEMSDKLLENTFKKYSLDTSIFKGRSISEFSRIIKEEIKNLEKISLKELTRIKSAIYQNIDINNEFVEVDIFDGVVEPKNQEEVSRLCSVLLSQGLSIKSLDGKMTVDNHKNIEPIILLSGSSLENFLSSAISSNIINKETRIEKDIFNKSLDFNLFSRVVQNYLGEDANGSQLSAIDELDDLIANMDSNSLNSMKVQVLKILEIGGETLFKDVAFISKYVELVSKLQLYHVDNSIGFNLVDDIKNNEGEKFPFLSFEKNKGLRNLLVNDITPRDFLFIATGHNAEMFGKDMTSKELMKISEVILKRICSALNKVDKKGEISKEMKVLKNFKMYFAYKDDDKAIDNYVSTIIDVKGLKSKEYFDSLKKYYLIERNPSVDEYSHVYDVTIDSFNLTKCLIDVASIMYEPSINIKIEQLESLINSYNKFEKSGLETNTRLSLVGISNLDLLIYYVDKLMDEKELDNSEIVQEFTTRRLQRVSVDNVCVEHYRSVFNNFLAGSEKEKDSILLGMKFSEVVLEKQNGESMVDVYLANILENLNVTFKGKRITEKEDLISSLFNEGSDYQKKMAIILFERVKFYASNMYEEFSEDKILVNRADFKQEYINLLDEIDIVNPLGLPLSDFWMDMSEDGKLLVTDNNKKLFLSFLNSKYIRDSVAGNSDFFKNKDIINTYVYDATHILEATRLSVLWKTIYKEVGADFYNKLWRELEHISVPPRESFKGLKNATLKCVDLDEEQKSSLGDFLYASNIQPMTLDKDVFYSKDFIQVLENNLKGSNYVVECLKNLPVDFYMEKEFMSLLSMVSTKSGDNINKVIAGVPKEMLNSPESILKILAMSSKKFETLEIISMDLLNYCLKSGVKENSVVEKLEIIFNTMLLEETTVKNVSNRPLKINKM